MLKTVVIGAGGISRPHTQAINELGIKIAGVLDPNQENAQRTAELYDSKIIKNLDEVIDEVDMIHLFTPPSKRLEYVRQAAKAGKHIFIEKPISIEIKDAEEMIECVKAGGVKMMVGFNHRFRRGFELLVDAVKSGKLGDITQIYSYRMGAGAGFGASGWKAGWRTDPSFVCGMSIESVSHDIDMLLQLTEGVNSISANVCSTVAGLQQLDNNASISFSLKNGGIGLIHASWSSYLAYSTRGVIGTKGAAMICGDDLWDFNTFIMKTDEMEFRESLRVGEQFSTTAYASYYNANKHFMECIQNDTQPSVTGLDGLKALKFSRAILDSSSTGNAVSVDI